MPITEGGRFTPNDRIVSPGVFTRENDLSGVAQGVADIGAAIVAPFPKGPGFAPTLVRSTAELEEKFGLADGVFYGPYTAKEYLKEKGFVTVCRVGALTGYNQKKPLVIYAQSGTWNRNADAGSVTTASSFLQPTGSVETGFSDMFTYTGATVISGSGWASVTPTFSITPYATYNGLTSSNNTDAPAIWVPGKTLVEGVTTYHSASISESLNISGAVTLTFKDGVATNSALNPDLNSGSLFYGGESVTGTINETLINNISGVFYSCSVQHYYSGSDGHGLGWNAVTETTASLYSYYSQSVSQNPASDGLFYMGGYTSVSSALAAGGLFSGSFKPTVTFVTDKEHFTTAKLISGSFTAHDQYGCPNTVIRVGGVLSGAFGQYNGIFTADSGPGFDNCGNYNSGSADVKILAVLANTRWENINSSLETPGFSGSKITGLTPSRDENGKITGIVSSAVLGTNSGSIVHSYTLQLSSSLDGGYGAYNFSIDPASNAYIKNVFGNDPTVGDQSKYATGQKKEVAYLYSIFEDAIGEISNNADSYAVIAEWAPSLHGEGSFSGKDTLNFTDAYSLTPTKGDSAYSLTHAYSPWVLSQAVAGVNGASHRFELFKIHALGDGADTNTSYKIEISNVKLAGTVAGSDWGSFTLAVRAYSDTENRPKYMEIFQNLSLDPNSPNFIARKIGDRYNYITYAGKIIEFGTYVNLSKYIRIEMSETNYPLSAVPYGFSAYFTPLAGDIANIVPTMKFSKASVYSTSPGKYASGVVFGQTLSSDSELVGLYPTSSAGDLVYADNLEYFAPLPANVSVGNNLLFALDEDYFTGGVATSELLGELGDNATTSSNIVPAVTTTNESTYVKMRKFVFGLQGGFDGQSPAIAINIGSDIIAGNTQGLNCATITSAGSVAYKQCIGALGNADEFDINLIATPGIFHSQHTYVAQLVIDMCESRGDCFYIMDNIVFPKSNQSVGMIDAAVNDVSTIDSNYVATYYPWVKILDTNMNKIISVPPSVLMPAIYAANDNNAAEWFAPAGLNRGGITQAVQVLDRLTHPERDVLYEGKVNPIAAFPGQGICVWGQKTLQIKHSALDRVNVRRLLIALKKFIASSSKYLVFEQNVAETRNRFLSVVNPYLESVQQRSGLYAFQVIMDETNNTSDIIDNNQMYGQIYLQPAKTAEFIILDFNILPTGATFPGA